jgi:hypothetical protein
MIATAMPIAGRMAPPRIASGFTRPKIGPTRAPMIRSGMIAGMRKRHPAHCAKTPAIAAPPTRSGIWVSIANLWIA